MFLTLAAAVLAALLSYTAIFALVGLLVPRRAIPAGLIYAAVVEVLLSWVPALANELAVSHYLRSLSLHLSGRTLPPGVLEFVRPVPLAQCLVALAVIPTLTLAVSALIVHRREWPLTEGV